MPSLVLFLSVPVFYIWGIVAFARWLVAIGAKNKQTPPPADTLADLRRRLRDNPQLTVAQVLTDYDRNAQAAAAPVPAVVPAVSAGSGQPVAIPARQATTGGFSQWYAENSIQLLLYVGAFLIVASASLLVGSQWGTISGWTKSTLLGLTAVAFVVAGGGLFSLQKTKSAGAVFMSIGNLLIPFVGYGWYAFVLRGHVDGGLVWMVTSVVSVAMSAGIGMVIRNRTYSYLANFGVLSFFLALVNMAGVDNVYYALGAEAGAFVIYAAAMVTDFRGKAGREYAEFVSAPMRRSSSFVLPVAFFAGLAIGNTGGRVLGLEPTLAAGLACLFYAVQYADGRGIALLAISEVLAAFTVTAYAAHLKFDAHVTALAVDFVMLVALIGGALVRYARPKHPAAAVTVAVASFVSSFVYLVSIADPAPKSLLPLYPLVPFIALAILSFMRGGGIVAYAAMAAFFMWVGNLYSSAGLPVEFLAAAMAVSAYAVFVAHFFARDPWGAIVRRSGYIAVAVFGFLSAPWMGLVATLISPQAGSGVTGLPAQSVGVMVLAVGAGFFVLESFRMNRVALRYLASLLFMYAVSWTMGIRDVRDFLAYTLPWGVYFLTLAELRRRAHDSKAVFLDIAGLFMLVAVNIPKILDPGDPSAAVIVGSISLSLFMGGITWRRDWYRWAGLFGFVVAVISRTYRYVMGIEKWMITSVLGFVFLAGAVFLLLRRPRK